MPSFRALLAVVAAPAGLSAADPAPPAGPVSYYKDVRPLFAQHCQGCHQPAKPQGDYLMTTFADLLKAGDSGMPAITPGNPAKSYLLDEIRVTNGEAEMPRGRPPLSAKQYELVERWIKEGAKDDTPAAAREVPVDADHPPTYAAPPVVTALAFSPDGQTLAVSGYHEVLLHKADGSGLRKRLIGLSERIQSLAFSPDGQRLAVAGGSPGRFGEVQIWDVATGKLKLSTPVTADTVYGASWSPDGKVVGFGCGDNTVRAIDADTGNQVLFMGTHSDWVLGTAFSQDGRYLVSASRDMSMKLTEVPTQRFVDNVTSITPGALKGGLMSVTLRPPKEKGKKTKVPNDDGTSAEEIYDELLTAGSDGVPRLYAMHRTKKRVIGDDLNLLKAFPALPGRVSCVRFDGPGERFAAASSLDGGGEVRVYDVASAKDTKLDKVAGPAYAVAWAADGKRVASAGFAGVVQLHDPATGKLVKEFPAAPLSDKTARK